MTTRDHESGFQSAINIMLAECLRHSTSATRSKTAWVAERASAVAMLRQVCEEYGDNDWPDNLDLSDVIEKHLWRNLEASDD